MPAATRAEGLDQSYSRTGRKAAGHAYGRGAHGATRKLKTPPKWGSADAVTICDRFFCFAHGFVRRAAQYFFMRTETSLRPASSMNFLPRLWLTKGLASAM